MARQCGNIKITGTVCNLTFYKLGNEYYVRSKSCLTGKRVKTDATFARTMDEAGLLAAASKIASRVYRQMDKEKKSRELFRQMTGAARRLLKAYGDVALAEVMLAAQWLGASMAETSAADKEAMAPCGLAFADALLHTVFKNMHAMQVNGYVNAIAAAPG